MSLLPISVVIPRMESRADFFNRSCLPSVELNRPSQIIVEGGSGNACLKRNAGAQKALHPYLVFVDDDTVLKPTAFADMLKALEEDAGASFAYSDVERVLYPGIPYPYAAGPRLARPWDVHLLKQGNYIDTTSLMRKEAFLGFDPAIRRFQDWDLWLTLAARGRRGSYIPKILLEQHHFDVGISASIPFDESLEAIRRKHNL